VLHRMLHRFYTVSTPFRTVLVTSVDNNTTPTPLLPLLPGVNGQNRPFTASLVHTPYTHPVYTPGYTMAHHAHAGWVTGYTAALTPRNDAPAMNLGLGS